MVKIISSLSELRKIYKEVKNRKCVKSNIKYIGRINLYIDNNLAIFAFRIFVAHVFKRDLGEALVDLSKCWEGIGNVHEAESFIISALKSRPNDSKLLVRHAELCAALGFTASLDGTWEKLIAQKVVVDTNVAVSCARSLLSTGDTQRIQGILQHCLNPKDKSAHAVLKLDAEIAEHQQRWPSASSKWFHLASISSGKQRIAYAEKGARCLIKCGRVSHARKKFEELTPANKAPLQSLTILAEMSIAEGRWQEAMFLIGATPAKNLMVPGDTLAKWASAVGIDKVEKAALTSRKATVRLLSHLALAHVHKSTNQFIALKHIKKCRRMHKRIHALFTAELLANNGRYSAAIWWLDRILPQIEEPTRAYLIYAESLIAASEYDRCVALIEAHASKYGYCTLYLRVMSEVHYRQSDFDGLRELLEKFADKKYKRHKDVKVFEWLLKLFRTHPKPHKLLPKQLHAVLVRTSHLNDSQRISKYISHVLRPKRAQLELQRYFDAIDLAAPHDDRIYQRGQATDILRYTGRWNQMPRVLASTTLRNFDTSQLQKAWSLSRAKANMHLGNGDVKSAEEELLNYFELCETYNEHDYITKTAGKCLEMLPYSSDILDQLARSAARIGNNILARKVHDWNESYSKDDSINSIRKKRNKRCFIVGNAPSLADLPLDKLAGEDIFCVNRGMQAMSLGLPTPNYLILGDLLVYKSHAQEIFNNARLVDNFFVASSLLWERPTQVPAIPFGTSGLNLSQSAYTHAPLHLHRGASVVVLAVQLAEYLGYKEIYIIGVDLDYSGTTTHFYGGGNKESARLQNFRAGGTGTFLTNQSFKNLHKLLKPRRCKLFNASPGGNLNTLPRVDFHSITS